MNPRTALWLVLLAGIPTACTLGPPGAVVHSLDGRILLQPPMASSESAKLEQALAAARLDQSQRPYDPEAAIWVGRRLGYLGRYREAIEVYTEALQHHPRDPRLYRHRGHRWLTIRELGRAVHDLLEAAELCRTMPDAIEPDGIPTPGRPPHSTLHYNVHYHLGLAQFCRGQLEAAERAWLDCLAVSHNEESRVAVCHWLWCVRMRQGNPAGAAAAVDGIRADADVVENRSYLQLCLYYAGKLTRDEISIPEGPAGAALRFGLAHHRFVAGDRPGGLMDMRKLANSTNWAAFGVLAAESVIAWTR